MPGSTDKLISGLKLKQDSIFNIGDLYKMMHGWFSANGYKFSEVEYRHFGQGDHVELIWKAERTIEDYAKVEITIDVLIIGMQKIEIEVEGAKTKSNQGSIELEFNVQMIRDPKDKYKGWMRKIYEKFIIKPRISLYQSTAASEADDLISEVKSFLQLHKF